MCLVLGNLVRRSLRLVRLATVWVRESKAGIPRLN